MKTEGVRARHSGHSRTAAGQAIISSSFCSAAHHRTADSIVLQRTTLSVLHFFVVLFGASSQFDQCPGNDSVRSGHALPHHHNRLQ